MTVDLDGQIKCLKREIAMRKNVYPKWVASGRMKQEAADHEIEAMTAALHTIMALQEAASFGASEAQHRGVGRSGG